ncbi:DNA-directed RNA polymerases IV and V subunit 4-like isoform X1 [Cynara cardunculus var. scolymus]|uniref:DNA-directed RNA polymerases IV and V subunit 4-like isoform X1 n=1 Tax=Cynara cardunculus var. scolymus TaxID=59895 RepID=UPI000D62699A|nr:DNA-directed RNA polymerases IV and V subunit 4-like isoform X1 [Cynara cardunculus var. scolymus]
MTTNLTQMEMGSLMGRMILLLLKVWPYNYFSLSSHVSIKFYCLYSRSNSPLLFFTYANFFFLMHELIFLGKGGKGDKGGKAGKGSAKKEPPPLLLKVEQELPENAKCLMDCEAAQILQGIQEHMVLLSKDPTIKIPSSFDRALQYANRGNHYTNPHSARQVLESLKDQGLSDGEMCVIANTAIESVGEAFGLMPSLKAKKSKVKEPLRSALTELEKLKNVTESNKKAIVLD